MALPVFNLPTTGTSPKRATIDALETEMNRVVGELYGMTDEGVIAAAEEIAQSVLDAAAQVELAEEAKRQAVAAAALEKATRAEFVAANDLNEGLDLADGRVVTAGGYEYARKDGATIISDLPGWVPNGAVTPNHFGAGLGSTTGDLAAFEEVETLGTSPVFVTGVHTLSAAPSQFNVSYDLTSEALVTISGGAAWNPRRYRKDGVTSFDRKVNPVGMNPSVPQGAYRNLDDSPQTWAIWINQWGYQQPDTNGNYSGSSTGPWPAGQTRGARTGAYQVYLQGSHSGQGDGYNLLASMAVTPAGHSPITYWSGQNSGGVLGFQVNAIGDKVNLYGAGDMVLDDKAKTDVAMLGNVSILYRSGADSGAYAIPRFNFMAKSSGTLDLDAAYIASGKFAVGLDLSQAVVSSGAAIAMASGQKIAFDAPAVVSGKFSAANGGQYHIGKSGTALIATAANNPTQHVRADRVDIFPNAESAFAHRVYGTTVATAFAAVGQTGAISYLSAASSGSDNTQLVFMTAAAGTEIERLRIKSTGVLNLPTIPTYASNAAAITGGLVAGDLYKLSTGEMRVVV